MADAVSLDQLEAAVGVSFRDRWLLMTALTHRSYLNEAAVPDTPDYERLEFLGDAFLDFVAGEFLYHHLAEAREGTLTAVRSSLVRQETLARFAATLELGRYLRLGRGEAAGAGRERPAVLCDAFEALVGALYVDQGLQAGREFVLRFLEPEAEAILRAERLQDAKSHFQELAQGRWQVTPHYETLAESGPDHERRFLVQVCVGTVAWGIGEGRSKSEAEQRAALAAVERIGLQADEAADAAD